MAESARRAQGRSGRCGSQGSQRVESSLRTVDPEARKGSDMEETADYLRAWYLGTRRSALEFVA